MTRRKGSRGRSNNTYCRSAGCHFDLLKYRVVQAKISGVEIEVPIGCIVFEASIHRRGIIAAYWCAPVLVRW